MKIKQGIVYCEQCGENQAYIRLSDIGLCENCFQGVFQKYNKDLFGRVVCGHPIFNSEKEIIGVCTITSGLEHDHASLFK